MKKTIKFKEVNLIKSTLIKIEDLKLQLKYNQALSKYFEIAEKYVENIDCRNISKYFFQKIVKITQQYEMEAENK